jgi:hypothetical protein
MKHDQPLNFRIGNDLLNGLRAVRERDGIPVSEQVRRAVAAWLSDRGLRGFAPARVRGPRRAPETK